MLKTNEIKYKTKTADIHTIALPFTNIDCASEFYLLLNFLLKMFKTFYIKANNVVSSILFPN